jgi:hypothetical protein
MANAEDKHDEAATFYGADKTVVAYAILPELAELGTVERLSDGSGIFQPRYTLT